jgi:acetyl-CoA carboxylase carboxyl transferase subunit beta
MHEGILSLMQMAKTNMALTKLKKPYISVLADPTFGGTLASFATQGTIILAEKNAQLGFAGPRVTKLISGKDMDEKYYTAEFYLQRGGVNEVVSRKDMKEAIHKYILSLS